MNRIGFLFISSIIACSSPKEPKKVLEKHINESIALEPEMIFDSTLAKKFEADQYGMKAYVMAFLKSGPNAPRDSIHSVKLQTAHMNNIGRLAEEGKLILAGPFYGENKADFRGIYIFNTASIDSAKAYTESDPAIKYGSLKMELINWYGSAALMGVNEVHHKIAEIEL